MASECCCCFRCFRSRIRSAPLLDWDMTEDPEGPEGPEGFCSDGLLLDAEPSGVGAGVAGANVGRSGSGGGRSDSGRIGGSKGDA